MSVDCSRRLQVLKLTLTNSSINISGAPRRVLKELDEVASYKVAGYFWSAAYKNGYWDGRHNLLKENPKTKERFAPPGMLDPFLEVLKDMGVAFEVDDKRREGAPIEVSWDPALKLRRYQLRAIKRARNGGIINMPIRAGKTKTAAGLIAITKRSTVFIVPSKQLLHQTKAALVETLGIEVGTIGDSEWDLKPVTVASVQSLARARNTTISGARAAARERWPKLFNAALKKLDKGEKPTADAFREILKHYKAKGWTLDSKALKENEDKLLKAYLKAAADRARETIARFAALKGHFTMLIMDECHHLTAGEWQRAVNALGCRYRVGLSATAYPDRTKEQAKGVIWLVGICGPIRIRISMSDLIDEGFLCQTRIIWHDIDQPRGKSTSRWSQKLQKMLVTENRYRNEIICDYAERFAAAGHRILIVCGRLDHVDALSKNLRMREVPHNVVTGQGEDVDVSVRNRKISQLIDGSKPVVIGTVFGEGVDIPEADVVINAEGGKDDIATVQRLRCLTKMPGKEQAIVVDFNDLTNKYFKAHSAARMKVYKSEPAFVIERTKGLVK